MANFPQFVLSDGSVHQSYSYVTNSTSGFFRGTLPPNTADVLVSVRGGKPLSDPDLVAFEGESFVIPNPSASPNGMALYSGNNQISVYAVSVSGVTSQPATVNVVSNPNDLVTGFSPVPPSSIFIERKFQSVVVSVDAVADQRAIGYHFYASTSPGGGTGGYFRVNPEIVADGVQVPSNETIGSLTATSVVAMQDGFKVADPQYLRVTASQVDQSGGVIQTDFDQLLPIPDGVFSLRTSISVADSDTTTRFSFSHDRNADFGSKVPTIPNSEFLAVQNTDPLYYVATVVYVVDGKEIESPFSAEVAGFPIPLSTAVFVPSTVTRQQSVRDMSLSIFRKRPEADIKPGSFLRDTVIDPVSTEIERVAFLSNFFSMAQSFQTLLSIDDPTLSGVSVPVSESEYKIALKKAMFMTDDRSVQNMIDSIFDNMASRTGAIRQSGQRAQGEVIGFVVRKPISDIVIQVGTEINISGQTFRTTSTGVISANSGLSQYDPITGRYYTVLFVLADQPGSSGNVSSNSSWFSPSYPNVQFYSESDMFGGTDDDSNLSLAVAAMNNASGTDTSTRRGLLNVVNRVSGVSNAVVVTADSPYMFRDYSNGTKTGGKTDVWCLSQNTTKVSETFAFSFESVFAGQFEPVGDVRDLIFRSVDPRVTATTPIIDLLDYSDIDVGFYNASNGYRFNMTDMSILSYNTVQFSSSHNDPSVFSMLDLFRGSFRFRSNAGYVLRRQPVIAIDTLTGQRTGVVSPSNYSVIQGSDPMLLGGSTESGDYLLVSNSSTQSLPDGVPISVTNEPHTYSGSTEYLLKLGAYPVSVRVYNQDRTIEYVGPYSPIGSGDHDFTIVDQSEQRPIGISVTTDSRISNGDFLLIDYSHDENFVVSYEIDAIGVVQNKIDDQSAISSDSVAKSAIECGVAISAVVAVRENVSLDVIRTGIMSNLNRLFVPQLGNPWNKSTVVREIDRVGGVDKVVTLSTMCLDDGSPSFMEEVPSSNDNDFFLINEWSTDSIHVYITTNELSHKTIDFGGLTGDLRSFFVDFKPFECVTTVVGSDGSNLNLFPYLFFVVGNSGLSYVPGRTQEQTTNRVIFSVPSSFSPVGSVIRTSYTAYGNTSADDIVPNPMVYLTASQINLSFVSGKKRTVV